mgnify:CR=1 FL=1
MVGIPEVSRNWPVLLELPIGFEPKESEMEPGIDDALRNLDFTVSHRLTAIPTGVKGWKWASAEVCLSGVIFFFFLFFRLTLCNVKKKPLFLLKIGKSLESSIAISPPANILWKHF